MKARDYMDRDFPGVVPGVSGVELSRVMVKHNKAFVLVVSPEGELLGIVTGYDLRRLICQQGDFAQVTASQLMTPLEELFTASPGDKMDLIIKKLDKTKISQIPVVEGKRPVGILNWETCHEYSFTRASREREKMEQYKKASFIIQNMHEGLVMVDENYIIQEFNREAERISGLEASQRIGQKCMMYTRPDSPVRKVMESGEPLYDREEQGKEGKVYLTNNVPILGKGKVRGVLQTIVDITRMKDMQRKIMDSREEIDRAFALTLPNTKIERKLKSTPEYTDAYDKETGLIQVTGVIPDGGYRHVVNCLKLAADLNEKGLFEVCSLDKDTLVQAILLHDIAKSQPELQVGQVVDPRDVFDPGWQHACLGADIARRFYGINQEVELLIRYHHHTEEELPEDFPGYLFPLYRLLQVVDGCSAGLTRRDATIYFEVNQANLLVRETNPHPHYDRRETINLFTGKRHRGHRG